MGFPARILWGLFTGAVLLFLLAPVLTILVLSFSDGSFFVFPPPGLGLRWYRELLASPTWLASLQHSLALAAVVAIAATSLGAPAAIGLWRMRGRGRGVVLAVLLAPLAVPAIVTAIAVTFAFAPFGLAQTWAGLALAHTALAAPLVVLAVLASLARFDPWLLRAAAASGAAPLHAFARVMLPLIAPGVASGAAFAFACSLEEGVVVLFLAGPGQRTVPREMFAGLKDSVELTVLAAGGVLILFAVVLMLGVHRWRAR